MQKLAASLVAFQAEAPSIKFDSTNPHFKSRFASLAAIHREVDPILAKHGLAVLQFPISSEGRAGCVTWVIHSSGESISQEFTVPTTKNDPQSACGAVSYARRYGLSGALGLVTEEDDDGEGAMNRGSRNIKPPTAGRVVPKKPSGTASPMSNVNKTKLSYAAKERVKELADDSIGHLEIINDTAKRLGKGEAKALTDDDFEAALTIVQDWEPGGVGA